MPAQTSYDIEPVQCYAGMLASAHTIRSGDIISAYNGESSARILFGRAVMFGSATDGKNAKLPVSETAKIMGIVVHSHSYESGENGDLTDDGVAATGKLSILRHGDIWVTVEDAVVPGDRLWVRGVAGGDPEFLGNVLPADDGTDTVDCTQFGQFMTAAAAGGLAKLHVNF